MLNLNRLQNDGKNWQNFEIVLPFSGSFRDIFTAGVESRAAQTALLDLCKSRAKVLG